MILFPKVPPASRNLRVHGRLPCSPASRRGSGGRSSGGRNQPRRSFKGPGTRRTTAAPVLFPRCARRLRHAPRPAMGSCATKEFLTRAHKERGTVPLPDQEGSNPPVAPPKESTSEKSLRGSGGATLAAYDVTALATSSLLGLIQSLKDHVTKPTAMAQGRVAHLIEWKGWSAPPVGWGQPPTEEMLYEELTDELKEARFAAGVAEQFAIAEATLSGWSSLNEEELSDRRGSQDVIQLQGSLQTFALSNQESPIPSRPLKKANEWSRANGSLGRPEGNPPNARRWQQSATSLRYVDSSSPSEDEVFYD
ncbi:protein FAM131C isoform X2 [Ahaetulla prasina]|uniref:protein FAM131C isoform X2 n=1 Tax=Ahaetulla prasina TaxID=499056 RepID=UPI002647D7A1|nr:protein FAM131C isoform X2 [Ahaetulla prasina]